MHDFATFDDAVEHARAFNPAARSPTSASVSTTPCAKDAEGRWTYKFDPAIGGAAGRDVEALWWAVGRLRCPTLLVRGGESNILTADGRGALRAHRARQRGSPWWPGAGHSVMGDNPPGFLAAVRPFLARHGL